MKKSTSKYYKGVKMAAKAKKKRVNPTQLPDELYFKKEGTPKAAAARQQKEYFDKIEKEDGYNPNGKADFERVLDKLIDLRVRSGESIK